MPCDCWAHQQASPRKRARRETVTTPVPGPDEATVTEPDPVAVNVVPDEPESEAP